MEIEFVTNGAIVKVESGSKITKIICPTAFNILGIISNKYDMSIDDFMETILLNNLEDFNKRFKHLKIEKK